MALATLVLVSFTASLGEAADKSPRSFASNAGSGGSGSSGTNILALNKLVRAPLPPTADAATESASQADASVTRQQSQAATDGYATASASTGRGFDDARTIDTRVDLTARTSAEARIGAVKSATASYDVTVDTRSGTSFDSGSASIVNGVISSTGAPPTVTQIGSRITVTVASANGYAMAATSRVRSHARAGAWASAVDALGPTNFSTGSVGSQSEAVATHTRAWAASRAGGAAFAKAAPGIWARDSAWSRGYDEAILRYERPPHDRRPGCGSLRDPGQPDACRAKPVAGPRPVAARG